MEEGTGAASQHQRAESGAPASHAVARPHTHARHARTDRSSARVPWMSVAQRTRVGVRARLGARGNRPQKTHARPLSHQTNKNTHESWPSRAPTSRWGRARPGGGGGKGWGEGGVERGARRSVRDRARQGRPTASPPAGSPGRPASPSLSPRKVRTLRWPQLRTSADSRLTSLSETILARVFRRSQITGVIVSVLVFLFLTLSLSLTRPQTHAYGSGECTSP